MKMPGGGCWNVAPGQITDDSELAMMMMNGLVEGQGKFDTFKMCAWYGRWY